MSWMGDPPMVFRPLWWWYVPDPSKYEVVGAEFIRGKVTVGLLVSDTRPHTTRI